MKRIFITSLLLILAMSMIAQADSSRLISGRVIDKTNREPLTGASILIRNTETQTSTSTDGSFRLRTTQRVPILVISFAEYQTKEIPWDNGTKEIIIVMEKKTTGLSEVTVYSNGYNTTTPSKATGAYTVIDKKLFNEQVGTNVLDRLKFIASGVSEFPQRIGSLSSGQLLIRGLGTFTSRIQKPLIILDNFEYQGDLANINPNDVENISILKDAAAAAIWGAKASNGVIVITTKKANYDQPLQISLTSNWSFKPKPDLFKLKNMSTAELIDAEKFFFDKGFYNGALNVRSYAATPLAILLIKVRNGQVSEADAATQINVWKQIDSRNDFEKYIYRKGIEKQQSLSLQGGSRNYNWILSGGFDQNVDNLNATYRRLTGRMENRIKLNSRMELSASLSYANSNSKDGRAAFGQTGFYGPLPSYGRLADENGVALPVSYAYNPRFLDTAGQGLLKDWRYYPLRELTSNKSTGSIQDFQAVIGINYQLAKGLKANVLYRYEKQLSTIERLYDQESFLVRDLANSYAQIDYANREVKQIIPAGAILDRFDMRTLAQNIRGQLDYIAGRGPHSFMIITGAELSETVQSELGTRNYGYDPERLLFSKMDYTSVYPLLTGGTGFVPDGNFFGRRNNRLVSLYANAAYTFQNKYTISGSARRDASNLFGLRTNDKWKPLWSVGGSWDMAHESFYKISWLPGFRLRVSYGHQGNLDPTRVAVTTIEYVSINPYTQTPYSEIANFPNDDLKWEQSAMLNMGLDLLALAGRIKFSMDYYHKTLTDLYAESQIDITTGIGPTIISNVGKMKAKGWDIKINTINTQGLIGWQTELLFNASDNKVVKFRKPLAGAGDMVNNGFLGIEGYSLYSMFTYRWAGLDPTTGDPRGYLNGQPSPDYVAIRRDAAFSDIVYNGSIIPKISGSIGNVFTWKDLSLATRISYYLDYVFKRQSIFYSDLAYTRVGHKDYADRWQKPGDEAFTDVPSFVYPVDYRRDDLYRNTDLLVEKGGHVRLEYINLSYQLSQARFKKPPFKSLELHAVLQNIGILWRANKKGIDPAYPDDAVPRSRQFSIGLNANF